MSCRWCKGTGKVELLYSWVECTDCQDLIAEEDSGVIYKAETEIDFGKLFDLGQMQLFEPPRWTFYDKCGNEIEIDESTGGYVITRDGNSSFYL